MIPADRLQKLLEEATPGPWEPRSEPPYDVLTAWEENDPMPRGKLVICEHAGCDARLIALAPELAAWAADAAKVVQDVYSEFEDDRERELLARLAAIVGDGDE